MTWAIKIADERREARQEGRQEGGIQMLYNLYIAGKLSLEAVAEQVSMSEDEFLRTAKTIIASDTTTAKKPF